MSHDFIHVRVDSAKKKEAENILNELGLTMTAGVNLYINGIIRARGLPFDVKLSRSELLGKDDAQIEAGFQKAVAAAIAQKRIKNLPVALYDTERRCPYLEYPDGRKVYDEG